MFFQVVIDKVLAHRGLTTLDVLIVVLGHRIGVRGAEGMPMERVVAAARTVTVRSVSLVPGVPG